MQIERNQWLQRFPLDLLMIKNTINRHIHGIVTAGCFDGDEETFTPFMADQDAVPERAE